jgi:hypothetical protein
MDDGGRHFTNVLISKDLQRTYRAYESKLETGIRYPIYVALWNNLCNLDWELLGYCEVR